MTAAAASEHRPLLRIAIVSYHSPRDELAHALGSVASALRVLKTAATPTEDETFAEILLIDNSEDGQLRLDQFADLSVPLGELNTELRLIQGQGNVGYGAAQNLALVNSRARFHLIMNPDVVVADEALKNGIDYLQQNPDVAVLSPAASDSNGAKQYLCKQYPSLLNFFLRGFMPGFVQALFQHRLAHYEMRSLREDQPSKGIPIISGCFMLGRTSTLQEVHGFDERYFLYFEDFDLSMRLTRHRTLAYLPTMHIIHNGGNAAGKGSRHIGLFVRSARHFFSTWGWRLF